jgi:hypothetical protein
MDDQADTGFDTMAAASKPERVKIIDPDWTKFEHPTLGSREPIRPATAAALAGERCKREVNPVCAADAVMKADEWAAI